MAENRHSAAERGEGRRAAPAERVAGRLEALLAEPLPAALHLVSTPIGNLGDITLRALAVLAGADAVYCEDTRHSRVLLGHYGIARRLAAYHEHNADEVRPVILRSLAAGRSVALACDAGTPLVSDPGFKLVREALAAGHRVVSVPGACAPIAALTSVGLPADTFLFGGFLPARQAARAARLAELAPIPATLVFFEAPSRLAATLADMAEALGPGRAAALARELTKMHEEVRRGTLGELAARAAAEPARGEFVVVVGPPPARDIKDEEIVRALGPALAGASVRDASRAVAEALGVARARVYDLALGLKRGQG